MYLIPNFPPAFEHSSDILKMCVVFFSIYYFFYNAVWKGITSKIVMIMFTIITHNSVRPWIIIPTFTFICYNYISSLFPDNNLLFLAPVLHYILSYILELHYMKYLPLMTQAYSYHYQSILLGND